MKIRLIALFAIVVVAGMAVETFAYTTWVCLDEKLRWSASTVTFRASGVSFPSGGSFREPLGAVADRWNNNPSQFNYALMFDEAGVGRGNGENEIWFSSDPDALDGAPAIAWRWYDCTDYFFWKDVEITEVDIIFDVNVAWTAGTSKSAMNSYGGTLRPFRTTAMHEFGHAQGLAHTNDTYNIMGQDWTHIHANGGVATAYPGEDASHGSVYLYGLDSSPKEDIGVVHWRLIGADDEYSTHGRTALLSTADTEFTPFMDGGEPRYYVTPGQQLRLQLTYENNGSNSQTVAVGFYLSTNDTITTIDTRLGGTTMTLGRGNVLETQHTLTMPTTLTVGANYYLGAIVDEGAAVSEVYESNNATYIGIRVQ